MKIPLIIVGAWSFVLLLTSVSITGAFGSFFPGRYYFCMLPFIVTTAVLVLLVLVSLFTDRARVILFWITIPLHGLLVFPWYYALNRIPGGDDGTGMAWFFFVGGGACFAGVMGILISLYGISHHHYKKKETLNNKTQKRL